MKKNLASFEFEGTNIEDAIQVALNKMNVSREMITIKVVCEEQKGLFGMSGAKPAKIKVFLK